MDSILQQLLSVYWLRPETALWRRLDIEAMRNYKFVSPSLDFGCGDGIFSFIRAGGRLDSSFDVFLNVDNLDKFFEGHDIYDSFSQHKHPIVLASPEYTIDVAFDHKENLLAKARVLGLYGSTKFGDGNYGLPFANESFSSIFSNIFYWLERPAVVLKELHRILRKDGELCLMLPDRNLLQYSFYNKLYIQTNDPNWRWLQSLDRGRLSDNIKQAKSQAEWEELFETSGLKIVEHRRHLSKRLIQVWDIGLRPLFPLLLRMVKSIPVNQLSAIKTEWLETLNRFAGPLLALEGSTDPGQAAFHCYVLSPAPAPRPISASQ